MKTLSTLLRDLFTPGESRGETILVMALMVLVIVLFGLMVCIEPGGVK